MSEIIRRQYRRLVDFPKVYQFMIDNYLMNWGNGAPAPFFEYSQMLHWTDITQQHRNAIWEEDGEIIGVCYYEQKIGRVLINVNEDHDNIINEMIEYAEERLSLKDGTLEFRVFAAQKNVISRLSDMGYNMINQYNTGIYEFDKGSLCNELPAGYSFEKAGDYNMAKMIDASWRGFDHTTEPEGGVERGHNLCSAPNATPELNVIVKDEEGEYVCYAGMWMVEENNLAYLEPLCTVPEHRKKGLAAAALTELYRRTSMLGATHMTGGDSEFYFRIGFEPLVTVTIWKRP